MKTRQYKDYDEYMNHQREKTANEEMMDPIIQRKEIREKKFYEYFDNSGIKDMLPPTDATRFLCLGARLGGEVRALRTMGYKQSLGVDLCPLALEVLQADFHHLPFKNETFSGVYSNSLDHCYDLKAVLNEADRILKPGGYIVLNLGINAGMGEYESVVIESPDEITSLLPDYEVVRSESKEFQLDNHGGLNYELILRKPE